MEKKQFKNLLRKFAEGNISMEEKEILFLFLDREEHADDCKRWIAEMSTSSWPSSQYDPSEWEPIIHSILNRKDPTPVHAIKSFFLNRKLSAAVILFIALTGFLYFYFFSSAPKKSARPSETVSVLPQVKDIQPGHAGAILTLADGSAIVLDSLSDGLITTQGNAKIFLNNGSISYAVTDRSKPASLYNMITTPRGRQYRLQLPDGTQVWLNAASSIRYPAVFSGDERKVTVTGEVYFEVAKKAGVPFRVKLPDTSEIEVLGTHFNVNAYTDEEGFSTTLLEGSVKIKSGNSDAITIQPGQQAQTFMTNNKQGKIKVIDNVQTENVIAWKNGAFSFQDATVQEVMRQLSRWYDVEIVYNGKEPQKIIRGKMGRDLSLSQIIVVLKGLRVNLSIEGNRKLVVLPDEMVN